METAFVNAFNLQRTACLSPGNYPASRCMGFFSVFLADGGATANIISNFKLCPIDAFIIN